MALVHAALVLLLAASGATVFLVAAERALDAEMTSRTRGVARMTARSIEPGWIAPLRAGSLPVRTLCEEELRASREATGAARLTVLDADGNVLASSDARLVPGQRDPLLAVASGTSAVYRGDDGAWYQSAYVPLGTEARLGAELTVSWRAPLERLRRAVIAFAGAGALAAAAIGALLMRGVTRPLARLAGAIDRPGADGLPSPSGVTGSDEVGALGARFDAMVEALRRHDAELRALSATVAHEVRNPLGAMNGFAELIARRAVTANDPETKKLTDGIREEVAALERLVSRFLVYSGDVRIKKGSIAAGELLRDAMRAGLPAGSQTMLEERFAFPGIPLIVDADAMREVVVNLVRNGAQAARAVVVVEAVADPAGVELRVRDDGAGIPAEIRARLFEPFATTKADGTGLGLAICRRIVLAHGGTLTYVTGDTGTTFVVRLPAHELQES